MCTTSGTLATVNPYQPRLCGLCERLEWLRRELAALDDPQTRLLVMRYRLGWTLQRIGSALGLKPGAVDGRLGRLTAALRRRAQETIDE